MSNDNATLTACREALAAMEQAEAAMTQGPWARDPYKSAESQIIAAGNEVILWHGRHMRQRDAQVIPNMHGIALLRNAAPGTLRFMRAMLEKAEDALLDDDALAQYKSYVNEHYYDGNPGLWIEQYKWVEGHRDALAMLAALADAMGVTGGGK